ncbi:hypothetical protein K493DRAFT_357748 [Basidiobolus meristosporus CBS 931.73]|uniref:Chromatin assembly factor 1 subunit Cac1-like C-terminal domain-containing protein n=1 Tax=Basidiobolus meristosporus CBS 931.73 TaxID=1314790 RepID=A0A1Y1XWM0_9FUNG|nr:hypothetical protein K493DRAFT_357748 [Basidiobolus meristosporus CBS 931.73]|eukprot:ORX89744.1 hypothetical protein K493DRAFT_357748 [Basidiobolus meristosporus CBS 931.73]
MLTQSTLLTRSNSSDLPLSSLALHVMDIVCPTGYKDDDAPVEPPKINPRSVEDSILLLARHHNYIDSNAILGINHEDERPCPNLAIVRWEVQNLDLAFSPDLKQVINRRREKQKQALFDSLPDDQKENIRTRAQSSKRKRKVQDVIDEELKRKEREEREAKKRKAKEQKEAEKRHLKEQKEHERKLQKEEERKKEVQKQKDQGQTRIQGFFSSIKKDRAITTQPEEPSDDYESALHSKHTAAHIRGIFRSTLGRSFVDQSNDAARLEEGGSILAKPNAPKRKLLQFAENLAFAGIQCPLNPLEKSCYPLYAGLDAGNDEAAEAVQKANRRLFPEERVEEFLKLVSGSAKRVGKLVEELQGTFPGVTKSQLVAKLKELASKEKC